ncbi:integrase core domain-containing protein [Dyella jejuensis]|uniref:integrase core domain-containing protein n=1 Tax=Dyella jejuensis TaxID=1432009 RepID=UPI00384FEBD5
MPPTRATLPLRTYHRPTDRRRTGHDAPCATPGLALPTRPCPASTTHPQAQRLSTRESRRLRGTDTIERRKDGLARYLITCIDLASRFSFALAFRTRTSAHAALTLRCAQIVLPIPIRRILSDNGGEFTRHFHDATVACDLTHWHTSPRTPKMNAHCERFNRTIQEEFVDYHEDLLFADIHAFNERLFAWLHWYNAERPHHGIALLTPLDILAQQLGHQCRMYWPNTFFNRVHAQAFHTQAFFDEFQVTFCGIELELLLMTCGRDQTQMHIHAFC